MVAVGETTLTVAPTAFSSSKQISAIWICVGDKLGLLPPPLAGRGIAYGNSGFETCVLPDDRIRKLRRGVAFDSDLASFVPKNSICDCPALAGEGVGRGRLKWTIMLRAPSLSLQPKSDVSDFGHPVKRPNSGTPEFGCKRGRGRCGNIRHNSPTDDSNY
jgi:hypothetical protein